MDRTPSVATLEKYVEEKVEPVNSSRGNEKDAAPDVSVSGASDISVLTPLIEPADIRGPSEVVETSVAETDLHVPLSTE